MFKKGNKASINYLYNDKNIQILLKNINSINFQNLLT